MKNKSILSEDELRQKVDGFSMEHTNSINHTDSMEDTNENTSYKIVDEPLYQTHSASFDKIKSNK